MRSERMAALLPLKTEAGVIVGLVTPDYLVGLNDIDTGKCCQDVRDWQGAGELRELAGPDTVERSWVDPYYWLGYRKYRGVICGSCGCRVNAHEYMP